MTTTPPKVINLFAGPGAGKSTTAAGLFHLMKLQGERVEMVVEYAKDLTYERNMSALKNQMTVLGEQFGRMHRLVGHVDWIITDSPLLLGIMYSSGPFREAGFTSTILWSFDQFDNRNIFIRREKPYESWGRNQTEDEARGIDHRVRSLLDGLGRDYLEVGGGPMAPEEIYNHLCEGTTV